MASPLSVTVNYDSLVSTTLNNTRAKRYDNIFRKSAFYAHMHSKGRKELLDGGVKIDRAVDYAVNQTVKSYRGYDSVDLTPQEHTTSIQDELKEVAGSIVISRREERNNSGRARIMSLIESKVQNLDRSYGQKLNEMFLAPSGAGLTAAGEDMNPITTIINIAAGSTLHGINATTYTWWENQRAQSASINGTATTGTVFKQELRNMYNNCTRNNEGAPDLVLTSQEVHEKYEEVLEGQVRYGSTEMANLGFEIVMLRGASVMWDEIVPRQTNNGGALLLHDSGSADEHLAYFINSDFFKLYVDSQTDLVNRPFMESPDQTAKSALVLFMGQVICTNRRTCGVLSAIDTGAIT